MRHTLEYKQILRSHVASVSVVRMVITALPDVDCRHVKHTGSSLYSSFALKCGEWYDGDMLSRLFLCFGGYNLPIITFLDVGCGVW